MKYFKAIFLLLSITQIIFAQELHRTGALENDPRLLPELKQVKSIPLQTRISALTAVDLSPQMPPVGNQGSQGSCVAWAIGYYHKTHTEWREHGWDVANPQNQFSPAFIYNHINGGNDGGAYYSDAIKAIVDLGVSNMSLMPYSQSNYTSYPSDTAYSFATRYRGAVGNWIDCSNDAGLDLIKAQLNNSYTVVLSIRVYANFDNIGSYENTYCAVDRYGTNRGGHGVTIVGYDDDRVTHDGTGAFKLVNSWGTGWGASGYFWMSYQAVKDQYLSQRNAYYVTDRIDYDPVLKARFRITHSARTRVGIRFGFGPTDSPRATKDFFNWYMGTGTNRSFPGNNIVLDLSDNIASLAPDSKIYLRCYDNTSDGLTGTINYYAAEYGGSHSRISPNPPVAIPDYGTYVYAQMPEPVFSVSPLNINYGEVSVFVDKQDSVTVSNSGIGSLNIISAVSDNSNFSVTPASGTIASGSSQKFYITFDADSDGPDSGSIIFTHDALDSPDTVTVEGNGATPEFHVYPVQIRYGDIPVGSSKTDSVTVTNTGNGAVNISKVESTDSTFIVIPKSANIPPSDSVKFYITFAPYSAETRQGDIHFFHDAEELHTIISMDGKGIEPLFTVSPMHINFGDLSIGSTLQDTVTVTNTGYSTLNISGVSSSAPDFIVSPATASIPPSDSALFYITFMPTSGGQKQSDIIFIHDALSTPDTVTAVGNVIAPIFTVSPAQISFSDLLVGSTMQDTVTVNNAGNATLNISDVFSSYPDYTVLPASASIPAAGSEEFYITFTPSSAGAKISDLIFVHDAAGSPDTVMADGNGVEPVFNVSPAYISYGDVYIGLPAQDSVTVTNTGTYPLIISGVSSTDPDFTVTPASANIPATEAAKFYITFAPTLVGIKSTDIIITHNASDSPDTIFAEGNCINPVFTVSKTIISFGDLYIGSISHDTVTVVNTGNSQLNISEVTSAHPDFTISPVSVNIPASDSTKFYITFAPSSAGAKSGGIIFIHNSTGSPDTITVNGSGIELPLNPMPATTGISPTFKAIGDTAFTLTVNGNNFMPLSVARFNGNDRQTTFIDSAHLTALIETNDLSLVGAYPITVYSPGPGGGISNEQIFTVNNPIPVITAISPDNATAGGPGFTLTVFGSKFVAGSVIKWNGIYRSTVYIEDTLLTAIISAGDIAAAETVSITVSNPAPGGGDSNPILVIINDPLPDPVVLVSPPNNTSIGMNSVILRWHHSQPQITKYWVEWSTDSIFSSPEIDTSVTDTFRIAGDLDKPKAYWWRVKARNSTGWGSFSEIWKFTIIMIEAVDEENIPMEFDISQNYPNPFNPSTVISYDIPKESDVLIIVYNVLGQEAATLVNEHKQPGSYRITWNAQNLSSGVYIYRMQAGEFVMIKKLIFAR